jgi:hypothetical protein
MTSKVLWAAALATLLAPFAALAAEDAGTSAPPADAAPATPDAAPDDSAKRVLTPEELAEKDARKACKQKLCDIVATREPNGDDVACDITKTWREEDIVKMLGGKINWPWGKAVCQSKLELQRKPLALAMSEPEYEIVMPSQTLRCTLAQKDKGDPYAIEITLAPKVKFKDGKASEAALNWGKASAPMFIYPLIYAGTGFDNSTNVLGPEVVRLVNEFTTKKCAELKAELPAGTPPPPAP